MSQNTAFRLAAIVALIGASTTVVITFFFKHHLHLYIDFLNAISPYLAFLTLIAGFSATLVIAYLTYLGLVAKHRADALKAANEALKSEVNERIAAEESKQKLEIALLQGQKLQAMGTLAGGIAHDFNNILYAINGYAEMAKEDVDKDSQVYKNLGKIGDGCHRGKELVARILAFSRKQHPHFDPLDIRSTLEAALALLRPTIPASVILEKQLIDATVLGNQTQLHQVIVNIINNAVDAMEGEGKIQITMSHVSNPPVTMDNANNPDQRYCQIMITDTGHGMDITTLERIFEPFYTTKEVGKGTGLGLSIAHTIIKEHQGDIQVKSQIGHGTTFTILLPEYKA